MTLRGRVTLAAAAVVATTVIVASLVCYFALRSALLGDVDDRLADQAEAVALLGEREPIGGPGPPTGVTGRIFEQPAPGRPGRGGPRRGGPIAFAQVFEASGAVTQSFGPVAIPITATDRAIAAGKHGRELSTRGVDGVDLRVLTFRNGGGDGVQVAQPLTDVSNALGNLALLLVIVCAAGTALAAGAAWFISRRVVAPITELSAAASRIEQTGDLDHRIETTSTDEVGTLATRFNAMLERLGRSQAALHESLEAQRRFVADASHELRTPVTSIRTNAELLAEQRELSSDEQRAIAGEIVAQSEEMTHLMADLIELARGDSEREALAEVQLGPVVERETERLRAIYPQTEFRLDLDTSVVRAHPGLIGRVVANLLDNAAKFGPAGGAVEVGLQGGVLTVTDHGRGIPAVDLDHVFDRFYRGAQARSQPGSGLGLSIVRQVAEAHGGSVSVDSREGEGTTITVTLPQVAAAGD